MTKANKVTPGFDHSFLVKGTKNILQNHERMKILEACAMEETVLGQNTQEIMKVEVHLIQVTLLLTSLSDPMFFTFFGAGLKKV